MRVWSGAIFDAIKDSDRSADVQAGGHESENWRVLPVEEIALPDRARCGSLSWCKSADAFVCKWEGSLLIAPHGPLTLDRDSDRPYAIVQTQQPRLAFAKVVTEFFSLLVDQGPVLVHPTAVVHPSAVIGARGQGYEWDHDIGAWIAIPHVGGVEICADVVIGPTATIMRGVIGNTVVGHGTKIGNGVNVGHGVQIGEDCLVVAHSTIGGSARIGNHVTIWQGACILNGVKIGDDATIGMGAVVLNDVPAGSTMAGNPARRIR